MKNTGRYIYIYLKIRASTYWLLWSTKEFLDKNTHSFYAFSLFFKISRLLVTKLGHIAGCRTLSYWICLQTSFVIFYSIWQIISNKIRCKIRKEWYFISTVFDQLWFKYCKIWYILFSKKRCLWMPSWLHLHSKRAQNSSTDIGSLSRHADRNL